MTPATASVLGVFAHPDDESLSAGGLLARHADAGARTAVVTATWSTDSHRAPELADALAVLGAGEPRMLGYADARVPDSAPGRPRWCDVPLDEAVAALAEHVRDVRPDVVLTHDALGGVTGHEDHVHTHRAAVLAVAASGHPCTLRLATHPHAVAPMLRDLIGERRAAHTVPDEDVVERLDVTAWLATKVAAVLAHRSEVERGALPGLVARMSPEEQALVLGTEWYA